MRQVYMLIIFLYKNTFFIDYEELNHAMRFSKELFFYCLKMKINSLNLIRS